MLLPAVRNADRDTLVIADGFSCREQIEQSADRRALHLAELLAMALDGSRSPGQGRHSEDRAPGQEGHKGVRSAGLVGAGTAVAGLVVAWTLRQHRRHESNLHHTAKGRDE